MKSLLLFAEDGYQGRFVLNVDEDQPGGIFGNNDPPVQASTLDT
jgi:hypothetical protein